MPITASSGQGRYGEPLTTSPMLRIARHSEIAGETAPATPNLAGQCQQTCRQRRSSHRPEISSSPRQSSHHHRLQMPSCPSARSHRGLASHCARSRGVDLFARSHASLIERPLCLVCARQSNRRGLHDLTPSDTAGRYEAALRSDDAVNLIQNCAALKEVRAVVEHKDWNSHERIVLANYVLCFEDEKLLKLERQFQDVQGHRNSTHIGREEIADAFLTADPEQVGQQ